MDCSLKATIIDDFSGANLFTTAQCILVVEKDAIFQKLISEGFLKLFPNALLVTVSGGIKSDAYILSIKCYCILFLRVEVIRMLQRELC